MTEIQFELFQVNKKDVLGHMSRKDRSKGHLKKDGNQGFDAVTSLSFSLSHPLGSIFLGSSFFPLHG